MVIALLKSEYVMYRVPSIFMIELWLMSFSRPEMIHISLVSFINTMTNQLLIQPIIMKKSRRNLIDKQNLLIHNILKNSSEGSRPKLRSIKRESMEVKTGRARSTRYQDTENSESDTIQLPTFGDWKSHIKFCQPNLRQHSSKLNSKQLPVKQIQTQEQQKPNERIKIYQEAKLKHLAQMKNSKLQPLDPIVNTISFRDNINEHKNPKYRRRSIQQTLSSKARALSRELQINCQTIDTNLNRIINRKQIFKNLYLKQKQKYQNILKKYKIDEKVDDSEFQSYFNC